MPLKNRLHHPPGGFVYHQIQTGWHSSPGMGFDATVREIYAHRKANLKIVQGFNLSLDQAVIAQELDDYTCARLNNDPRHCMGISSPKASALHPGGLANVVAGVKKMVHGAETLTE